MIGASTRNRLKNVMWKKLLAAILAMALAQAPTAMGADIRLPDIGEPSGSVISPDQEDALGERLMRHLRQELLILDDPLLQSYIESLGARLVTHSDRPAGDFTFFMVNDPSINAFAAPGGYIGVNSGLMLTTENESELAAVMAHEITHVTQRHMARTYEAAGRYQLAAALAILAAVLVGGESDQLAQAAIAGGTAASAQMQIDFTRANEREADRLGIQTLAAAGYDPESMATFFERMQRTSRLYGERPPEFLSTHPVTTARIAESRSLAQSYNAKRKSDQLNYELMRARLRVLGSDDPLRAQQFFERELQDAGTPSQATRYGYALAQLNAGQGAEARKYAERLLEQDPDRIAYLILAARAALASGAQREALATFERALLNYPNDYPLTYFYAEALLQAGEPKQARAVLQNYMHNRTPNAAVHRLYAQAASAAGQQAEAYRNMAEYYFLTGQTHAAIDQLTRATQLPGVDFYEASQIEARLQELKRIASEERS